MRALSFAGTIVAFVVVGFMGMVFAVVEYSLDASVFDQAVRMLAVLAALVSGASMFWRMKYPTRVLLLTASLSILLPIDPIGPAVALSWVAAKNPKSDLYWAVPLAGVAMALPFVRDFRAPSDLTVMAALPDDGVPLPMSGVGYLILWVVMLAFALAAGYVRRVWGRAEEAANVAE